MPVSELHRQVAAVALRAAAPHGFAIGGGNALIAHGIIDRPTQDLDLVTDQEHGVEAAAEAVEAALRAAGYEVEREDKTAGLADIFEGMGQGLAEWTVTAAGGRQMILQMAYFERLPGAQPVIMEFGPVLDLEDAVGWKTVALAARAVPRDYFDVAAALQRFTIDQLIGFAKRLDPGLRDEDFADAGQRLDRVEDGWFASLGISGRDVARLRDQFAAWPRSASLEFPAPPGGASKRPPRPSPQGRRPGGRRPPHP
jgi:Nucleotidyl transferase AbiEii toxin, Type IV TA system